MCITSMLPEIAVTVIFICLMPESDLSHTSSVSMYCRWRMRGRCVGRSLLFTFEIAHFRTLHAMEKFNFGGWNDRGISTDPSEDVVCSALDQYGIDLAVLMEMKDLKVCYELFQQVSKDDYRVFYSDAPEDGRNHHGVAMAVRKDRLKEWEGV